MCLGYRRYWGGVWRNRSGICCGVEGRLNIMHGEQWVSVTKDHD